jgi:hypothetical protein
MTATTYENNFLIIDEETKHSYVYSGNKNITDLAHSLCLDSIYEVKLKFNQENKKVLVFKTLQLRGYFYTTSEEVLWYTVSPIEIVRDNPNVESAKETKVTKESLDTECFKKDLLEELVQKLQEKFNHMNESDGETWE